MFSTGWKERDANENLARAMRRVDEQYDGQGTMNSFERYNGLDALMVSIFDGVARKEFGRRFVEIDYYGKPSAYIGAEREGISLEIHPRVKYSCIINYLKDQGVFMDVFTRILDQFSREIKKTFPEVRVSMIHDGLYRRSLGLQIKVHIVAEMPMLAAA